MAKYVCLFIPCSFNKYLLNAYYSPGTFNINELKYVACPQVAHSSVSTGCV